jgi:hypothetical protein
MAPAGIPGTDVCKWPAWLLQPLVDLYPGLAAACVAGIPVTHQDLAKYKSVLPGGTPGSPTGTLTNPLGTVSSALGNLDNLSHALTEPATWRRVGEVIIGGGILLIGISAIFKSSQAGQATANAAKKASLFVK